jgi:hypothetical protein
MNDSLCRAPLCSVYTMYVFVAATYRLSSTVILSLDVTDAKDASPPQEPVIVSGYITKQVGA